MSVVGFDVGNLTCFIAVAKQGGIETVANEYSMRSTPTYVGFTDKMRVIGQDSKNIQLTGSNFKNVAFNFKRLLGRKLSDPFVKEYSQNLPYKLVALENDDIGVVMKYLGTEQVFSITQIMAAMLTYLKGVAETALTKKVVDCVISVPSYYTDVERRAMLDAARIAELNCLRLMNDTTATGLCYGFFRKDLPDAKDAPKNVVFVDFGHSALQICIVAFNKGQMKVLAVASDFSIGGLVLDKLLVQTVAVEFREKYDIDPLNEVRPYLKLMNEVEKLKILMSANKQKLPIHIECFMKDIDVTASLSREDMERDCKVVFQRVEAKFEEILKIAKLAPSDIHSVEIVGGSSRVSLFKDLVKNVFGHEPSTTLNADESVARGCALQCAMLSSASQVRDKWTISDVCQFPITLRWQPSGEKDGNIEVFPYNHLYPATKLLTFYRREPFDVEAVYTYPKMLSHSNPLIGNFTIHEVTPAPDGGPSKIKIKLHLNKHGIFNVSEALSVEKVEDAVAMEEEVKSPEKSATAEERAAPAEKMEEDQAPNGTGADGSKSNGDQPMDTSGDPTADPDEPKEPATSSEQSSKKKTKYRNVALPIKHQVASITLERLNDLKKTELEFQATVRVEKEKQDGKNALEEYILDLRHRLSEELEAFVKETDAEKIRKTLDDCEDWLYEDGEDCDKQLYFDKLYEMKKIGNPIITRKVEFETRPRVMDLLGSRLNHFTKFLEAFVAKAPEYDHISEDDGKKVKKAVDEKRKWFEDSSNKFMKTTKYDEPPILVSVINEQVKSLDSTCNPIVNKPKPKAEPPAPPAPQSEAPQNGESNANDKSATGNTTPSGDVDMDVDQPKATSTDEVD